MEFCQNTPTLISIEPPITKKQPSKKMRNLYFWWLFLQIKNCWILNFKWIKYLGKGLSCLKDGGIGVNYCWNHGPSKLLLHFIEYSLDQLNNKHKKTAVNSKIQFFETCCQKKCLINVWKFLAHPPQNDGLVKFLRKWTETIF